MPTDDATPEQLVTGQVIKDRDGNDNRVDAVHKNANGDVLNAELTRMYDGHTVMQDPSEDIAHPPTDDSDTASQVGQPSRSGQHGPTREPRISMSAELDERVERLEQAVLSLSARVLTRSDFEYVDDVDDSDPTGDQVDEPTDDPSADDEIFDDNNDQLALDDGSEQYDFAARAHAIYQRVALGG